MKLKLSQGIPWSKNELTGFGIAVLATAILSTLLVVSVLPDTIANPKWGPGQPKVIPNPRKDVVPLAFVYVAGALMILNYSPLKRLHAFVQYLACVAIFGVRRRSGCILPTDGAAVVPIHLFMGLC